MKDCKITKAIINERQELFVNMVVKFGDYQGKEYHLLRAGKIDGHTYDIDISGMSEADNEQELKERRKNLAYEMGLCANRMQEREETLIKELYKKYNIKSRKELTLEQLDFEIEEHRKYGLDIIT